MTNYGINCIPVEIKESEFFNNFNKKIKKWRPKYHVLIANCMCKKVNTKNIMPIYWAYGVVVSMFDFHRSDQGSNPGRGGKISCLRLHYRVAPFASV